MHVYIVTDKNRRVHQFIYPERVWVPSDTREGFWFTRAVTKEDHRERLEAVRNLVRNAISARRLLPQADTGPMNEETSDAAH